MSRRRKIVVKLGGSLAGAPELDHWLDAVVQLQARASELDLVVVPGGGPFADAVRVSQAKLGFNDVTAHAMALLAMDQFGHLLCGFDARMKPCSRIEEFEARWTSKAVPVWLPSQRLIGEAGLDASWNVTSDTISAWLAHQVSARQLILVKSCPLPAVRDDAGVLSSHGAVDGTLPDFVHKWRVSMLALHKSEWINLGECASRLA
jgi:5-(aminomethyl)-3-furanmethanol phosphate kinase